MLLQNLFSAHTENRERKNKVVDVFTKNIDCNASVLQMEMVFQTCQECLPSVGKNP